MSNLASMITELGTKFDRTTGDLGTRLSELEKRAARAEGANDNYGGAAGAFASILMANRDFGKFDPDSRRHQRIELGGGLSEAMAAITSGPATVGSNTSAGTSLVPAHRLPGIVHAPERKLTVRDLIAAGTTTSNMVEWPEETDYINGARPQTEGQAKGESDLKFELRSAPVRTLAHTFPASKQIMDDVPALAAYIGNRGLAGLKRVEEQQLLYGDGTGQNLSGIMPQAANFNTALLKAGDSDEYAYLRRAVQQIRLVEHHATGILLHPNAAADMDLIREDESGKYWIDPRRGDNSTAWRLPVVETTAIQEDEFVVADWTAAQIFDRQQAVVEFSSEHDDFFARNMILARIEERLALAVYQPAAFVVGEFGATATSGA